VGEETADSILLYAAERLTFPADKYTKRMIARMGFKERGYAEIKGLFEASIPRRLEAYKEYHALIDALGKTYCRTKPRCGDCPLTDLCEEFRGRACET
ncbi:MAG: endonuclease, partial [Candidatus Bathyarchaeia archaeon]